MSGLTTMMLTEHFGSGVDDFIATVASATSDDDVLAYVRSQITPEQLATWEAFIAVREPRGGDRVAALGVYPWLGERPDLILNLDVLEEDDRRTFAAG
jgi:hypothetical protein